MRTTVISLACLLLIGCGAAPKENAGFRFADGDGYRDLLLGDTPVWRDMIKYDPADRENTYKVYKQVYAFDPADGFITKGAGGKFPHHRGLFLGFKTQFGDFWHCPDVTQRHVKYLADREIVSADVARSAQVVHWVAKDEKPVVRDTREVTTRRISPTDLLMDFEITLEALTDEPIQLGGDPHHAGFHFRAAAEVTEKNAQGTEGLAVYVRNAEAKALKNDVWEQCDWVHATFPIKGKPYAVTHFDPPTNPRPIQYSTRPYGRFGSFFTGKLEKDKPLKLRYRIRVRSGEPPLTAEQVAAEYGQYSTRLKNAATKRP